MKAALKGFKINILLYVLDIPGCVWSTLKTHSNLNGDFNIFLMIEDKY